MHSPQNRCYFFACFRLTRTRTWSERHGRREKAQKKYIPPSRVFRAPRPQRARLQNERKNSAYSRIKHSCPHLSRHECLQRNKTSMATFGGSTNKLACERAHLCEFGENVFGEGAPIPRGERDAGCEMRAPTPKQFSPNSHKWACYAKVWVKRREMGWWGGGMESSLSSCSPCSFFPVIPSQ